MTALTEFNVEQVQNTSKAVWNVVATEHVTPRVQFMHSHGEPYITAWDTTQCDCRRHRILRNLYDHAEPRTAQAFLCCRNGDGDIEGIDIINVHVISGHSPLKDLQRLALLRNLRQSNLISKPSCQIGAVRATIGGDINSEEMVLNRLISKLIEEKLLRVNHEVMRPMWGNHGYLCINIGLKAIEAMFAPGRGINHD